MSYSTNPNKRKRSAESYSSKSTHSKYDKHNQKPRGDEKELFEQENPNDYGKDGYYPVRLGEVLADRFHVIRKLGWGHFSTVWLSWDANRSQFVAIKIVKASEKYAEAAEDEIKILQACMNGDDKHMGKNRISKLFGKFYIFSSNGKRHVCMVFEVLGCNLLKKIVDSNYKGLPLNQVRVITRQILQGLSYLHETCSIIHTDIKPENILVELTPAEVLKMAQDIIEKINSGQEPDVTEICNLPSVDYSSTSKAKKKRLEQEKGNPLSTVSNLLSNLPRLNENKAESDDIRVKIADLGNGCWTDKHFSDLIQTREYRAVEVLVGAEYDTSADIWSVACLAFELATGNFLFEPKGGKHYDCDDQCYKYFK